MKNNIIESIKSVYNANIYLNRLGLVVQNFGNASSNINGNCLIKPSGVDYASLNPKNIVSVKIDDGVFDSKGYKPSSDICTHLELYREYSSIGGIVHTHSTYATGWAQAGRSIPCIGTTHADYWNGDIPITRELTDDEINGDYEKETGKVIIEKIKELNINPLDCPGILVANHGPFTWGATVEDAVKHAELLENIAKLAWLSISINPDSKPISKTLLNKHYSRKHGPNAYYGQDKQ